jgi:hypothetical protein
VLTNLTILTNLTRKEQHFQALLPGILEPPPSRPDLLAGRTVFLLLSRDAKPLLELLVDHLLGNFD